MILAGIDIGTNTFRLLIAEAGPGVFREISSGRKITRLGQDLDRTGLLSREAQERSVETLVEFSAQIGQHAVRHVSAAGTSALRTASNSQAFIDQVKQRSGLDIRVLSGEEEARLTLLGVARALQGTGGEEDSEPLSSALVIDIGGGSTEIIVTAPGHESREVSLPLGAVYLSERFIRHDPPHGDELRLLRGAISEELDKHRENVFSFRPRVLAGTAGTITTLAAMDQKLTEYDPDRINRSLLTRRSIEEMVLKLSAMSLRERRTIPGLEHGREDIILAGAVITQEIMERCGSTTMLVSDWGLREGIVLDLYEKVGRAQRADGKGHGAKGREQGAL